MRILAAIALLGIGLILGAAFGSVQQSTAEASLEQQYAVAYTMYDSMGEVAEVGSEEDANLVAAELKAQGWDNTIVFSYTPE